MQVNLSLENKLADHFSSPSQKVRVLTELWLNSHAFCPNCGNAISQYPNNQPVADFFCSQCNEDFELKSKAGTIGRKVVDGAYKTMIERLNSNSNPSFFFLSYDKQTSVISNLLVIPKYFFIPNIIERRKPLAKTARRAGWVGCNILLDSIPKAGKVFYIEKNKMRSKKDILSDWNRVTFLKKASTGDSKGWLMDVMLCIDTIGRKNFSLREMYAFENHLQKKYPENRHIKEKIRQQLQLLRDKGYLGFKGQGQYEIHSFSCER